MNLDLTYHLNLYHLFSFVPILGVGGVLWYERMIRHRGGKRTVFLFLSLLSMALVGVFQALTQAFPDIVIPAANFQVVSISVIFYFLALMFLEYSIHCKRIDESFLTDDFQKSLRNVYIFAGIAALIAVIGILYFPAHAVPPKESDWFYAFQTTFINRSLHENAAAVYRTNIAFLAAFFTVAGLILFVFVGRNAFNLQAGVIRMRSYPFLTAAVTILLFGGFILFFNGAGLIIDERAIRMAATPEAKTAFEVGPSLPLYFFLLINLVYTIRMVEEFFYWAMFNLRSDRQRIEARQHALNVLIRRVVSSPDEEDRQIVKETVEKALEKARGRMVVQEYNITGTAVFRVHGNVLKIDTPEHLFGYCSPLVDNKSFKNLDKNKLNDMILRSTYDLAELRETPAESLKDYGQSLIKKVMVTKEALVVENLPENYKGLQRLIGLFPILDGNNFMGLVLIYKDSFFRVYPAEKEILNELCENLGTIFSLMNSKEIQRERNRLQGEMNTARNIQTSILPKTLSVPGYQVFATMETATEVGGDVYDLVPNPFGQYMALGDVSGHGLPAGMMATIQMAAFHGALETSKTLNFEIPIDNLYEIVNRVLCEINRDRIGSDKFMTMNYFVEKQGVIHHSGASVPGIIYSKAKGEARVLDALADRTAFLGISEYVRADQSVGQFKMDSGDILLLFSDGVIEAKNGFSTQYGLDKVKDLLQVNADKPLEEIFQLLNADLTEFAKAGDLKKNGGRFSDDVSVFLLRKE